MGTLQCIAREGELPLPLMQEPQILLPEESTAVDLHARGACIVSGFIPLQRRGKDGSPLRIHKPHREPCVRKECLVQAVRRHEPRVQTDLKECEEEECRQCRQLRPPHPRHILIGDGVRDKEHEEDKWEHHHGAQHLLLFRLFEEEKERREDLAEPERPVDICAPCESLLPLLQNVVPCEREELLVEVVAEDECGEQEIESEHRLQPRRHPAVDRVLVCAPRDPEECDREPRTEHVEEIPEHALQCAVVYEREDLRHTRQLPEEQHGDEEDNGAARPVMEHTAVNVRAPDDRERQHQHENHKSLVRLCRHEHRPLHDLCVIARVHRAEDVREIRRHCVDSCGRRGERRITCGIQLLWERL